MGLGWHDGSQGWSLEGGELRGGDWGQQLQLLVEEEVQVTGEGRRQGQDNREWLLAWADVINLGKWLPICKSWFTVRQVSVYSVALFLGPKLTVIRD